MDDLADGRLNRMDEAEIDLQVLSFTQPGARACTLRMRLRHLRKLAFRSFLQAGSGHRAECIWHQAMEMAVASHFVSVGQAPPDAASKSQFVKVLGAVLDHGLAAVVLSFRWPDSTQIWRRSRGSCVDGPRMARRFRQ